MDIQSILMQESDLLVRRIKDGTVIDHIDQGKGLKVLEALEIDGKEGYHNIGPNGNPKDYSIRCCEKS